MVEPSEMPTYPPTICQFTGASATHEKNYPPGAVVDTATLRSFGEIGIRQGVNPRQSRCSGWCGRIMIMNTEPDTCTGPSGIPHELVKNYTYANSCANEQNRLNRQSEA